MIRQCEFQTMYDPDLDMYVTKHIFDEDIPNIFDEGMTVGGGMTSRQLERNYLERRLKVQHQLESMLVIRLMIR